MFFHHGPCKHGRHIVAFPRLRYRDKHPELWRPTITNGKPCKSSIGEGHGLSCFFSRASSVLMSWWAKQRIMILLQCFWHPLRSLCSFQVCKVIRTRIDRLNRCQGFTIWFALALWTASSICFMLSYIAWKRHVRFLLDLSAPPCTDNVRVSPCAAPGFKRKRRAKRAAEELNLGTGGSWCTMCSLCLIHLNRIDFGELMIAVDPVRRGWHCGKLQVHLLMQVEHLWRLMQMLLFHWNLSSESF